MTWNCLGMTDGAKQGLLRAYKLSQKIDIIILQEGDQSFDNPKSEGCEAPGTFFLTDLTNSTIKALNWVFDSKGMLFPMSGVSRKAYYNVVADAGTFTAIADTAAVDYSSNAEIKKWILGPATKALGNHTFKWESGRSRAGLKLGSLGKGKLEDLVKKLIRDPTQKRVSLLGHRRPKKLHLTARGIDVYYWHAPLGRDSALHDVGFMGDDAYKARGCGGEMAVVANRLFANFLCPGGVFPDNTIVCGDLNIKADAAKHIYNTTNVVSDADEEWCHVIAASTLPLTMITNSLDQTALGYSDHPPVVVEF